MLFKNVTYLDENFSPRKAGCVSVENGVITYIGDEEPRDTETVDCKDLLMIPAFCSAHSHNAMVLLRGAGTDLPLQRWLNEAIFPKEAMLTGKDIYNGTLAACAEMLRYGVASSNDMYIVSGHDMIRAYRDAGMKSNVSVSVTCFDPSDDFKNDKSLAMYETLFSESGANDGDVRVIIFEGLDGLSVQIQNTLLKFIEEPLEFNRYIFTAESRTPILRTVPHTVSGDAWRSTMSQARAR